MIGTPGLLVIDLRRANTDTEVRAAVEEFLASGRLQPYGACWHAEDTRDAPYVPRYCEACDAEF